MFDINTFKERLRLAREAKGLRQDEFAEILGISRSGYSYYETKTNDALPGLVLLDKIMEVLGVSYDYLMGKDSLPTFNKEKISEITGLDENAIDLLEQYNADKKKYISVINAILSVYPAKLEYLWENIFDYLEDVMKEECSKEDVMQGKEFDMRLYELNHTTSGVRDALKDKLGMKVYVVPAHLYHTAVMEQIKTGLQMVVEHAYATYEQLQIEKSVKPLNDRKRSLDEIRDLTNFVAEAGAVSRERLQKKQDDSSSK